MPSPPESWIRLPSVQATEGQDLPRNWQEIERWMNRAAPIFPLYEENRQGYSGTVLNSSATYAKLNVPNSAGGTGIPLEMTVFKTFDWTVLRTEIIVSGYVNVANTRVEISTALNNKGVSGPPVSTPVVLMYFNQAATHMQFAGSSVVSHAVPAGKHLVSVMFRTTPANTFLMDVMDSVIFRVQECPPMLRSGERW